MRFRCRAWQSARRAGHVGREVLGRCHEVARAFRFAEELLHQEGLGTFGHIMTRAVDVLMRRKSVLERQQRRARFILIDEFQDSNVAQIRLASLLAGEQANVFAVGDPDQAIYQFRGATSEAFDQFLQTFGPERVAARDHVGQSPLDPADSALRAQLIQCNPDDRQRRGRLVAQPLTCARLDRDPLLANAIAGARHRPQRRRAGSRLRRGHHSDDAPRAPGLAAEATSRCSIAAHFYREQIVAELTRRDIPVRVKGADLFETPELRDAMAALRILDSSHPVALFRVAALAKFNVDPERFRDGAGVGGPEGFSAEAALEKVPGGLAVVETIRAARSELIAGSNALPAALKSRSAPSSCPTRCRLRRLRDFANRWCEKPKQISGERTLGEFLQYVAMFCNEANGMLVEENDEDDPVAALEPTDLRDETAPRRSAVDDRACRQGAGVPPCVRGAPRRELASRRL